MTLKFYMGRVKFKGLFDFEKLYQTAYDWMTKEHYYFILDRHKHKPPRTMQIKFHGEKKVDGYNMYFIYVEFYVQGFKQVEVVQDGKKKDMVDGRIWIDVTIEVRTDYEKLWTDSPFKEKMKALMDRFVLRDKFFMVHLDHIYYKAFEMNELFKETLGMSTHNNKPHKRPSTYDRKFLTED